MGKIEAPEIAIGQVQEQLGIDSTRVIQGEDLMSEIIRACGAGIRKIAKAIQTVRIPILLGVFCAERVIVIAAVVNLDIKVIVRSCIDSVDEKVVVLNVSN